MEDKCCGESDCSEEKEECSCCSSGPQEKVDVSSLGPEAVELAGMFDEVNDHLMNALKAREKIIATVHKRANESPEMKEKMNKVLESMHPGLLQFVFGNGQ